MWIKWGSYSRHQYQAVATCWRRWLLNDITHWLGGASIVFLWPWLYYACHYLPLLGRDTFICIGNDFNGLYYVYKVYLLDSLSHGHFPLWSASEAAGFPFISNPFAQALYPFNLLLVWLYRLHGGMSIIDYSIYTVSGVVIFGLGLYCWLRCFPLSPRAVLFSAILLPMSFKMAEILRFPNAVHTAAWYPWILFCLTKVMQARRLSHRWFAAIGFAGAMTCLLTGGYLYYVVYAVFLIIPYLCILLLPPLRRTFFPDAPPVSGASVGLGALALALPLGVLSPYLLMIKALMAETTDRSGTNFAYSTAHRFDWHDTLGSLIFPPASQAEGWYFFGIISLLLIVLYCIFPRASLAGETSPMATNHRRVAGVLLLWYVLITYITYGKSSLLFIFLWHHLPVLSSMRVWGRMNIILLPIIALFIAFAVTAFEERLKTIAGETKHSVMRYLLATGLTYTVILSIQLILRTTKCYDEYWINYFKEVWKQEIPLIFCGVLGFIAVFAALIVARQRPPSAGIITLVMAVFIGITTCELAPIGMRMWCANASYSSAGTRTTLDIDRVVMPQSITTPRQDTYSSLSLNASYSVGIMENWYYHRYITFRQRFIKKDPATERLLGVIDGRRLFFTKTITVANPTAFIREVDRCLQNIRVKHFTGEIMAVHVYAPTTGYVSYIDNWDPDWTVFVDGKPGTLEQLFGTFKSVHVPQGHHTVVFSYQPPGYCQLLSHAARALKKP